jgi:hypothetical protein
VSSVTCEASARLRYRAFFNAAEVGGLQHRYDRQVA